MFKISKTGSIHAESCWFSSSCVLKVIKCPKTFEAGLNSLRQEKVSRISAVRSYFLCSRIVTSNHVEPILHLNPTPSEVISYISAQYVNACPAFREHNGYAVPKRIIKQFLFSSQETQLHHSCTKTLCHATHKISLSFCARTKWFWWRWKMCSWDSQCVLALKDTKVEHQGNYYFYFLIPCARLENYGQKWNNSFSLNLALSPWDLSAWSVFIACNLSHNTFYRHCSDSAQSVKELRVP